MINNNLKKCAAFGLSALMSLTIIGCTTTSSSTAVNNSVANANGAVPAEVINAQIGNAQTPTEAFKALFAAVKSRNTENIKKMMSKDSVSLIEMQSSQSKQSQDQVYSNGLTATTMAAKLPEIRDERIKDNFGAVEVWNETTKKWDDVPFIKEDGSWKLAVGDIFSGTYKSPGTPQSFRENEAANAANPNAMQIPKVDLSNANVNRNVKQPPLPSRKEGAVVPTPKQ